MMRFRKQPKQTAQLISHLKGCGLAIRNDLPTRNFIESVGYYRVSGYVLLIEDPGTPATYPDGTPYLARSHTITPPGRASFREVRDLYAFDEKLKEITMSAISRVEVAIRVSICDTLALKTSSAHWYTNPANFRTTFTNRPPGGKSGHAKLIDSIDSETRRNNIFCNHYRRKYNRPVRPPIWMVAEQLSMGKWAIIYPALIDNRAKRSIAKRFDMNVQQMEAAILALSHLRNLCAHHARLLSANYTHLPINDPRGRFPAGLRNSDYAYMLATLWHMLKAVQPKSSVIKDISRLCARYPNVDTQIHLGLPVNWNADPFWE